MQWRKARHHWTPELRGFSGVMNHAFPSGNLMDESGFGSCQETVHSGLHCVECGIWWMMNYGVFLFSGVGLGPLVPVKETLNASGYQNILDNSMLPTLWEQFGARPFPFQHDNAPMHTAN